jgi:DNA-binding transcriptional ArsR family regulator
LADASRRQLLDRLHQRNGQTLGELCQVLDMTRQAVAKHLAVLEKANLVSWKRQGREKLHLINPVPINQIAERWISKFEWPLLCASSEPSESCCVKRAASFRAGENERAFAGRGIGSGGRYGGTDHALC